MEKQKPLTALEKLRDFYAGDADPETRDEMVRALEDPNHPLSRLMSDVRRKSCFWLGNPNKLKKPKAE